MELRIRNFKGYKDSDWFPLKPLTLIYGQNAVGKSAVIESLMLSEQIFELLTGRARPYLLPGSTERRDIRFDQMYLDLGDFESAVFNKKLENKISFSYRDTPLQVERRDKKVTIESTLTVEIENPGNICSVVVEFSAVRVSDLFVLAIANNPVAFRPLLDNDVELEISKFFGANEKPFPISLKFHKQASNRAWQIDSSSLDELWKVIPTKLKKLVIDPKSDQFWYEANFSDGPYESNFTFRRTKKKNAEAKARSQEMPLEFDREYSHLAVVVACASSEIFAFFRRNYFGRATHLPAYRGKPKRLTEVTKGIPDPLQNSAMILARDQFRRKQVIKSLKAINVEQGRLKASSRKDYGAETLTTFFEKQVEGESTKVKLTLPDLGFGVSQVLPLLVAMANKDTDVAILGCRVLCIEEPESHLHPFLQGSLIEHIALNSLANKVVFEPFYKAGADFQNSEVRKLKARYLDKMKRFVIETHSENFLKRIQKLIKNDQLASDGVAILFCDEYEEVGPKIFDLGLDSDGSLLRPWPNDFLETDR